MGKRIYLVRIFEKIIICKRYLDQLIKAEKLYRDPEQQLEISESDRVIPQQGKEDIHASENSKINNETYEAFEDEVNLTFENDKIGTKLEENLEGSVSRKRPVGLQQVVKKTYQIRFIRLLKFIN